MMGGWVVSAVIRFSSNGALVMGRLASSANLANASLARQQGLITRNQLALARYKARMDEIRASAMRFAAIGSAAVSAAGFDLIGHAVSDAAKLQTALIGVRNATGATNVQMERLRQTAYDLGDKTGQSVLESARLMAVIARSSGGVFSTKNGFDMNAFQTFLPKISEFASIQHYARSISVESAADTGIQLVHLFRQYSGSGAEKMFDQMTRLSEMMPHNLSAALTQFGYFLPKFKALGISDENSVATMALLDRMGYGRQKGGTNVANLVSGALGTLQLTRHAQEGKRTMLVEMGILNKDGSSPFFTDNKADLFGFLSHLADYAGHHGRTSTDQKFESVFGKQGGRIAELAIDPVLVKQLRLIQGFMGRKDISQNEQFARYQNSLGFQFGRAVGNLRSVMTELGWPWLTDLTNFFRGLGDRLHGIQMWLHSHRDAEKQIGAIVFGLSAIFGLFAFGVGATMIARLSGVAARLEPAFAWIASAFGSSSGWMLALRMLGAGLLRLVPIVGWVMLIVGGISALAWAFKNLPNLAAIATKWWNQNQSQIGYSIGYAFGTIARMMVTGLNTFADTVEAAIGAFWGNLVLLAQPNGAALLAAKVGLAVAEQNSKTPVVGPGIIPAGSRGFMNAWDPHSGYAAHSARTKASNAFAEDRARRSSSGDVHIQSVTLELPGVTDAASFRKALPSVLHPQSLLQSAGVQRQSGLAPAPLSAVPAF